MDKKTSPATTHFGYQEVAIAEKSSLVKGVFDSVASKYDLMNDLMSLGVHRAWKHLAVNLCQVKAGQVVLDLAGGTGDLSAKLSHLVGSSGTVVLADINQAMIDIGRQRLLDQGIYRNMEFVLADAQALPFPDNFFNCIIIGFGLRNVTDKQQALQSMYRVLKPAGKLIVLEFSQPTVPALKSLYDAYSFRLLPKLGKWIAKDEASYRYLAESIRQHPDQQTLLRMLQDAGFDDCCHYNLSGGIVAVHKGYKY